MKDNMKLPNDWSRNIKQKFTDTLKNLQCFNVDGSTLLTEKSTQQLINLIDYVIAEIRDTEVKDCDNCEERNYGSIQRMWYE